MSFTIFVFFVRHVPSGRVNIVTVCVQVAHKTRSAEVVRVFLDTIGDAHKWHGSRLMVLRRRVYYF